jgi:hypothetical protein
MVTSVNETHNGQQPTKEQNTKKTTHKKTHKAKKTKKNLSPFIK